MFRTDRLREVGYPAERYRERHTMLRRRREKAMVQQNGGAARRARHPLSFPPV